MNSFDFEELRNMEQKTEPGKSTIEINLLYPWRVHSLKPPETIDELFTEINRIYIPYRKKPKVIPFRKAEKITEELIDRYLRLFIDEKDHLMYDVMLLLFAKKYTHLDQRSLSKMSKHYYKPVEQLQKKLIGHKIRQTLFLNAAKSVDNVLKKHAEKQHKIDADLLNEAMLRCPGEPQDYYGAAMHYAGEFNICRHQLAKASGQTYRYMTAALMRYHRFPKPEAKKRLIKMINELAYGRLD